MDKTLGKDYPPALRVTFLQDNCDKIEEMGYMKRFTPEEIQEMKENLSESDIKINDLEDEKKDAVKRITTVLDPLKKSRKEILKNIKQKAEFVKENCFKFLYEDERLIGYYNSEGDLIESRPATSEELQKTIFQVNRTGTNN
jgi:hypothetical protein